MAHRRLDVFWKRYAAPILSITLVFGFLLTLVSEPIYRDLGKDGPPGDIIGWNYPYNEFGYATMVFAIIGLVNFLIIRYVEQSEISILKK